MTTCFPDDQLHKQGLAYALRRAARLSQSIAVAAIAKTELNYAQWWTLRFVAERGPFKVSDLARDLEMTSGAMTRLLDCLEARDLVWRKRSTSDRRIVSVTATLAARDLLDHAKPALMAAWADVLAPFNVPEIIALTAQLSRLGGALQRATQSESDVSLERV